MIRPGWYTGTEDGIRSGPHRTRRDAIEHDGYGDVLGRHRYGPGDYEYRVGVNDEECTSFYVFRHNERDPDRKAALVPH